jgi:PTS system nitrogen regulatory IIA component
MDLKIKDVADLLNVSETTIRRWLIEGKIPAYRMHHQYRFSRIEIENWMMSFKLQKKRNVFPIKEQQIYPENGHEFSNKGMNPFCFYRALHKGSILHNVEGKNKEEIIQQTMELVAKDLALDALGISELLLDRERLMPTALNSGIAVPHTRDFLLTGPFDIVLVVYLKRPIDWGALDGIPVHTLFFLFASNDKRHLHLLAKIAHLSSDKHCLEFLQRRPNKQQLLEFIKDWESKVRHPE